MLQPNISRSPARPGSIIGLTPHWTPITLYELTYSGLTNDDVETSLDLKHHKFEVRIT